MKKLLLLLTLLIAFDILFAQPPGGFPGAGAPGGGNNGHIYGKVTDSAGKPLSDVSVVVLQGRTDPGTKK